MLSTIVALGLRILSNPCANAVQKKLAQDNSSILINLYSFGFLSLFCLFPALHCNWGAYDLSYWIYAIFSGFLCTLGSVCLIKALEIGEISVLGPINSYKCVVGLVLGIIFLKEIPNLSGLLGLLFIVLGSWFIFDTVKEGFSFALLKRKDILLRFGALLCSGIEAIVLKKVIIMSSALESFILWCIFGFLFSIIFFIFLRREFVLYRGKVLFGCVEIALCLGVMQLSTNFVFKHMNVGLALALFQLSSIVTVILGYKFFKEQNFYKKLIGSIIMILGSCLILL